MNARSLFTHVMAACLVLLGGNSCSLGYNGPVSDHFDGDRFFMEGTDHSFSDMIKWMWEMEAVEWPEWVDDPPQTPPSSNVGDGEIGITYINHATVLIQMDGLNILTDPIWSMRAGPLSWLGVKRIRNPGVGFEDLPRIDVVIISHDHYDHLDLPTLSMIEKRDQPLYVTGLGLKDYLRDKGLGKAIELDWWQEHKINNSISLTFVPALHDSGRWPLYGNSTLWGGYVISNSEGNIYFAGDTGYGDFFEQLSQRFRQFRLTILPIGSYEKRWFMKNQHMNPEDAVKAHQVLKSQQSVGIHFGTFAEHPEQTVDQHEKDLAVALKKYALEDSKFWILQFGEGRVIN